MVFRGLPRACWDFLFRGTAVAVTLVPLESSLQVWEPRTATPARPVRTAASLSSWA
jgi:hypothetical protein